MDVTGHIGQHVKCSEFLGYRCGERIDCLGRKYVKVGTLRSFQSGELVRRNIGRDDPGAFPGKSLSNGSSDALTGSRDERQFSFKPVTHGNDSLFNGCRAVRFSVRHAGISLPV